MSDKSLIEWTDATWNPVTGCSKVSPGCAHCYAERLSLRFGHSRKPWLPEHAAENVVLHPERLEIPLRWRTPRRVFVNSMSDLFHELVPDKFIDEVFRTMVGAPQHVYQILTKRPERMRTYLRAFDPTVRLARVMRPVHVDWPLPNVWLGVSAENQHWADERIPILMRTPAAVRFVSAEPLLGPIKFSRLHQHCPEHDYEGGFCSSWHPGLQFVDWVIVGGESGPGARAMDPDWVRSIRDQLTVPFFFKQWGGRTPKAGGRELDGRTWDEVPA